MIDRPARVSFVIDGLSRAGTETQLVALINALDRRRVEPSLVLLHGNDAGPRDLEPADCPVLRLGVKSLAGPSAVAKAARLHDEWTRRRPDVVQTYFLDSTYFAVPVAKWAGVRRVVRVRNNLGHFLTARHRWLGRVYGRWVDLTLTNSQRGKSELIRAERLRPGRVAVMENGVDVESFKKVAPPDPAGTAVNVGAVANLRPVKNIDGLIRAARVLVDRHPRLTFEVAGDGPQRPELEALIGELRLRDHVRLVGSIDDVPNFLARQDIAVLCSHSEGMSNALLEYMAAGRAIVATGVGANPKLVRDGREGAIVPAGDGDALAAAVEGYLADPASARRHGAAARRRAEGHYSRAAMVRRFEDFYARLASGARYNNGDRPTPEPTA